MASIEISLKEIAKLINFYLDKEGVEEIKNIRVEKGKLKFSYNAGKLFRDIPLSIRVDDFKNKELVIELEEHSIIPLGSKILKAMNSKIEKIINYWIFSDDLEEDDELCLVEENYIYIPIKSIEKQILGEYPFNVEDIEIENDNIRIIFKI